MFTIDPGHLTHSQLIEFLNDSPQIELNSSCWSQVDRARDVVGQLIASGETVYGLNTGFGLLANQAISENDLAQLQVNLIRSHAAGYGNLLDDRVVQLIMLLKLASLARGYSGVRRDVIEILVDCLNARIYPCIPAKGSVGASGDLAPLAHMSLALIGEGNVRVDGTIKPAKEALAAAGITPLQLDSKEGLGLINGTQVSTSLALIALYETQNTFHAAIVAGALSVDAAMGSDTPFDARIHAIRNQPAQIDCATMYRTLLAGSQIRDSHRHCSRVQDPYSLRCQPQVMGACLESIRHVADVLLREANAVSDNPLVFEDAILSGGNFHAEPVAIAADHLAIAIAEIGALSERRIALLIDRHLSELPSFLTDQGGLNSGFMIPQVTAAALASENKHLAHAASVDSLPTSANQEDHVSMATYAARRLLEMLENNRAIVAIELLAACQGIDFRRPLKTSDELEQVFQAVRELVPFYDTDRPFDGDINLIAEKIIGTSIISQCLIGCPHVLNGDSLARRQ
ncbi:MAG: histidine ammonia-lyase [Planctomycetota bacterium]